MHQPKLIVYITGFLLSIVLTVVAFDLVTNQILQGTWIIAAVLGLAVLQFLVQLVCFLHLTSESGPRWNLLMFVSTISVVLVVVLGSIWIMHNLNYRHTIPTDAQIIQDENISK